MSHSRIVHSGLFSVYLALCTALGCGRIGFDRIGDDPTALGPDPGLFSLPAQPATTATTAPATTGSNAATAPPLGPAATGPDAPGTPSADAGAEPTGMPPGGPATDAGTGLEEPPIDAASGPSTPAEDAGSTPPDPPPAMFKLVFLSSTEQDGDMGGLAGGDAICQGLADNAGLVGTFKAWLSDSNVTARDRMAHSDLPYQRVDGTQVANNWADLVSGSLRAPINQTELGETFNASTFVWTGTAPDGTRALTDCDGWRTVSQPFNGSIGSADGSRDWTWFGNGVCRGRAPIYCIEQ